MGRSKQITYNIISSSTLFVAGVFGVAIIALVSYLIIASYGASMHLTTPVKDVGLADTTSLAVLVKSIDPLDPTKVLYEKQVNGSIKKGSLKIDWVPDASAKKKNALIELHLQTREGVKISCPYFVAANSTGFFSALSGHNNLSDSQRVGCRAEDGFANTSKIDQAVQSNPGLFSQGIQLQDGGLLVVKDGKLQSQNIQDIIGSVEQVQQITYLTTNVPAAGPQGETGPVGASGVNGSNGASGADGATGPQGLQGPQGVQGDPGLTSVSGGGLVLSGANLSLSQSCIGGQVLRFSGGTNLWECASVAGTDAQTLSLAANTLSILNGNSVDLTPYLDNTDNQSLTWTPGTRTLALTNGGSVVISDSDTTYTAGTGLTLAGTTFNLTNDFGSSIDSSEITNGTITSSDLANTGATAGTYGDTGVSVAQLTVNAQGQLTAVSNRTLPTATTAVSGILSSTDWNTFNGKENVLTFSDGLLRSTNMVTLMDCAATQILQRNVGDTAWVCANQVTDTDTTYSAGTGLSLVGTTFANTGILGVSSSGALTTNVASQNAAITLSTTANLTQAGSTLDLSNTGVTAGTYNNVTVDGKGRVTSGTNVSYLTSETDGVIGNEVAGVVANGGLVMTGSGTSGDLYRVGLVTTCADNQILKYTTVGGWACANDIDTDTNTDAQTLTWNTGTNMLDISGGNSVDLSSLKDNTDSQTLSIATNNLSISGGNSVSLAPYLDNTDSQAISLASNTLSISGNAGTVDLTPYLDNTDNQSLSWNGGTRTLSLANGGSVVISDADTTYSSGNGLSLAATTFSINAPTCSGTTKLQWSGSAFVCSVDVDTDTDTTNFNVSANGAAAQNIASGNTVNFVNGTGTTASRSGNNISFGLNNTGVTAGTYGSSTAVPVVTVDAQGRVSAVTTQSIAFPAETDGIIGNEVSNVTGINSGLVRSGAGTTVDPYTLAVSVGSGLQVASNQIGISSPTCSGTDKLQWNGTAFVCATDQNTTYSAGSGLALSSTTFSLAQQGATAGQVLKWDGSAWTPAADDNTSYGMSVTDGTTSQAISSGDTITFVGSGGLTAAVSATDTVTVSLNNDGVTSAKILDGTVVATDLAAGSVGGGAGGVIADNTVDANDIAAGGVNTSELALNAVTNGKLATDAVSNDKILDGTILFDDLSANGCTTGQIIKYNGTAWSCGTDIDTDTDTTYSAGTGLSLVGTTFNNSGVLSVGASGAVASSGGQNPNITLTTTSNLSQAGNTLDLSDTGVTTGTYNNVTVDGKGRVTNGSNVAYLTSEGDAVVGNEITDVTAGSGLVRTGTGTAGDPYKVSIITSCGTNQLLKWNGSTWACANDIDTDTNTDAQTLSIATNNLSITGGNSVSLAPYLDNTDAQAISLASNTLSISGNAGTVDLTPYLDNTDNQSLTWTPGTRTLALTNGGSVVISDSDTTYTAGTGLTLAGTTFNLTNDFGSSIDSSEITNGTITSSDLANTGATAGTYGDTGVSVAQLTVNAQGQLTAVSNRTLPTATTAVSGILSSTDWNTFNGKENVLTFTGNGLFSRVGNTITGTTCANNEIFKSNGTSWVCSTDAVGGVTDGDKGDITTSGGGLTWTIDPDSVALGTDTTGNYVASATGGNGITVSGTAGEGWIPSIAINAPTCSGTTKLQWNGTAFICSADVDTDTNTDAQTLTYTPSTRSLSISGGNSFTFPLADGTEVNPGLLSQANWNTFNGKENVLSFTGNGLFSRAGNTVTGLSCSGSQIAKWSGSAFACGADNDTTYAAGTGLNLSTGTFNLANTTVTANTYAPANNANGSIAIPQFTVDAQGRLTAASTTNISVTGLTSAQIADGTLTTSDLSATAGIVNGQLANSAVTVTAGNGLTNGGSVSLGGTTTLNIGAGTGITVNTDDISLNCAGAGASGLAFCQGGNSFGQAAVLGTNDANALTFETGGTERARIDTSGRLGIGTTSPQATLHNAGSTILGATSIANLATGGNIGTAAATVDIYTVFNINQTTTGQSITIPSPTNTTAGRVAYINNIGTAAFTIFDQRVEVGQSRHFIWSGTAWLAVGDREGDRVFNRVKAVDQSNNTTTLQNDNNLSFPIKSGETWAVKWEVLVDNNNSANPDFKAAVQGAAGWTCDMVMSGGEPLGTAFPQVEATDCDNAPSTLRNTIINASTIPFNVEIQGWVTATSDGTVRLQWSSDVTAGNLTMLAGSKMVAYKVDGADYAEVYYSRDTTINKGMIVELDGSGPSQVRKSSSPYRDLQIGIVSAQPGQVVGAGDGRGAALPIALSGRVPVKLSTENGLPKAGDMITASATKPGYGMLAKKSGAIVGQMMVDAKDNGNGTAEGFVYVRHGQWQTPVSFDISGIFGGGLSVDGNGQQLTQLGIDEHTVAANTSYSGFDQAIVDQIVDGFKNQQAQIGDIKTKQTDFDTRLASLEASSLKELVWNGGIVSKDTTFNGLVAFTQPVTFSGSNVGTVTIPAGASQVRVTLPASLAATPTVTTSKQQFITGDWRITGQTANGFVIELQNPQTEDVTFDWHAF